MGNGHKSLWLEVA